MDKPEGQGMLSEISQSQKDEYCTIPPDEGAKVAKIMETESRKLVNKDWGKKRELVGVQF